MVRASVTLNSEQLKKIDSLARKNKKSRAQVIREAVVLYVAEKEKEPTWGEIVKKTAGIWKHKKIDGLTYERQLREEGNHSGKDFDELMKRLSYARVGKKFTRQEMNERR